MNLITLPEVDSTNSYVERNVATLPSGTVVTALNQTAGKGQRGNSWESAAGKNITITQLLRPDVPAARQWRISQTVALCVCRLLKEHCGIDCKVKWPNDIYVGDKKICGILISHSLMGRRIQHTIIGAGININQEQFLSDAPNPVSVYMLTGKRYPLPPLIQSLGEKIERAVAALSDSAGDSDLHRQFMQQLWRGDGRYYSFCEPGGTPFQARVIEIEPMGHLLLSLPPEAANRPPQVRRYAFKEVIWL